jgi:hypothetical protein
MTNGGGERSREVSDLVVTIISFELLLLIYS